MVERVKLIFHRNWFWDDGDIAELIWSLDEPTFETVYQDRREFPLNVQKILEPHDFLAGNPTKIKVLDSTQSEINICKSKIKKSVLDAIDKKWKLHCVQNNIRPPSNQYILKKKECELLKIDINQKIEVLEKKQKFLIPKRVLPETIKLQKELNELELVITEITHLIEVENELWNTTEELEWVMKNGF